MDFAHHVLPHLQLQSILCAEFKLLQEQQPSQQHSLVVIIAVLLTPIYSVQLIVGLSQGNLNPLMTIGHSILQQHLDVPQCLLLHLEQLLERPKV
jgi:hypothetical protein